MERWGILLSWLRKCQIVFMMSLDPRKNDFFISPQLAEDLTESHSEEEATW